MDLRAFVPSKLSRHAKLNLVGDVFNGLGNGAVNVVLQLYLVAIGLDSIAIGTAIMANALGQALLTVPAGLLADRYGRKKVFIPGAIFLSLAMVIVLTTREALTIALSFFMIGVTNATFIVMTPLFSSFFENEDMDRAFGLKGFINVISNSAGSLLGVAPVFLVSAYGLRLVDAYWVILALGGLWIVPSLAFYFVSMSGVKETRENRGGGFKFTLTSRGIVAKFCLLNFIGNVGYGIFFSLFPVYASKRFDIKSDTLGLLYFVTNFVQAGSWIVAARISRSFGTLRTISLSLGSCVPFYFMIALAPNTTLMSLFYVMRSAVANLASPLQSSLFMKLLYDDEKSTASSFSSVSSMMGNIVAPVLSGQLMEGVSLELPAYLGSGIYAAFSGLYYLTLRKEKEKEEEQPEARTETGTN
jgi:MFS family permease